jgi:ATP-dependent Clp protease ATP-binding subunit ClpA
LLLDEIEKAHPDIFNILLQILDYGNLADSNGRKINFKNTIIVMTSNTGAIEAEGESVGFIDQGSEDKFNKAVSKAFTPEFRNRLDGIVNFNSLSNTNLESVVQKLIIDVEAKLNEKGIDIEFNDDVIKLVLDEGYDPKLGARPLSRAVDRLIKKPLSSMLIEDKIKRGSSVKLTVVKGAINLKVVGAKEKIT